MKKVLIIIAAVIVIAVFVVINIQKQKGKATSVEVEEVSRQELIELVSASGKIQPKISVDISADITGKIVEVAVEEGDKVDKGDLLFRIDPTQFRESVRSAEAQHLSAVARRAEAEARLEQQQLEWDRSRQLHGSEDISDRDYEAARTSLKLTEAQLESAQRSVEQAMAYLEQQRDNKAKTEIRAPMHGVIVRRDADVGEIAMGSTLSIQVLMVIADLSVMEVEVDVDETEIPRVTIGQKADIEIDAFPDDTYEGTVTEIANSPRQGGNDRGVDFRVVITMDQSYSGLRPGLSATAEITTANRDDALAIPIQALTLRTRKTLEDDEKKYSQRLEQAGLEVAPFEFEEDQKELEGVMIFTDGRALFVPVETGIAGEKHFEVLSGLGGDEQVITGPMRVVRTLGHGQRVKIEKDKDSDDDSDEDSEGGGISVSVETDE